MKKSIIIMLVIVIALVFSKNNESNNFIIPRDAIRIRIIANSNTLDDQQEKLRVVRVMEDATKKILNGTKDYMKTKEAISQNMDYFENLIKKTIPGKTFNLSFGNHYFPKKIYKSVEYPEGNYESLLVTIGKGNGNNWWCVLFPPLCLMETNENINEVEYKSYFKELFNK